MSIQSVGLLGADGKLGPATLHGLLKSNFKVTVIKRQSSKSKDDYPSNVNVVKVPDDFAVDAVASAIKGLDAMIVTIKGSLTEVQYKLAQACVQSGVRRFIPADFGSCDSSTKWAQDLVPLFKHKTELRSRLMKLAEQNAEFTWTSLVCGHFFDWSPEFLHVWIKEQKADILDDGETKWSTSTFARIAEATVSILLKLEATANQVLYVQSFCISQNEVIRSFEKATASKWQITKFDSKVYEKEQKAKANSGDLEAVEDLVWLLGALDANWETRDGFAMEKLGLKQDEDLDEVVQRIVQENQ